MADVTTHTHTDTHANTHANTHATAAATDAAEGVADENAEPVSRTGLLRRVLAEVDTSIPVNGAPTDLHGHCVDRAALLDPSLVARIVGHRDALKRTYHTSALSCLHGNSTTKQVAPAVCMVRQLLKANDLRLAPRVQSQGYDKATGRKLVRRYYEITAL